MKINWQTKKIKISDLIPAEYNPRKLDDDQEKRLKDSIDKFDVADPIIINADNKIIGGHQRIKVLKNLGYSEVDVRFPDRLLSLEEEKELNLRLNKNTGDWDFDLLSSFEIPMLEDVGFTSVEIDKIFKNDRKENEDDAPDAPKEAKSKKGDIYKLGSHRVMCGDSTDINAVEKLMNGQKSRMIHTDPPYNVDYGSSKKNMIAQNNKFRKIINDKLDSADWERFCKSLFVIFKTFNTGDIYMWGAPGPEGMRMRLWLVELGCHWSATIIWKKQRLVFGPANYQRIYEPCFYGWFDKSSFCGIRNEVEVWEIDRPSNSKLHPTMKPIEICEKAILNSSDRNDIVLDLFLGSGSTLIACEKHGRICYGMELDPIYVDVIVKRWEEYTGKKAELIRESSSN